MQNTTSASRVAIWWRRNATRFLAFCWFLGIALGCMAAAASGPVLADLVRRSTGATLSITGAMTAAVLPLLLSAFAVSFSEPWLLLFISTFKAFSFSFCAWGVCLAFGQSGWLVLFLFLFSDFLLIPLQYFYWLRHIRGDIKPTFSELPLFLAAAAGVGCIDFWYIAPFLASLMQ